MGTGNWFIRSQQGATQDDIIIPLHGDCWNTGMWQGEDNIISLCRLVAVDVGVITWQATSVRMRGLPLPGHTCALVPASGFFTLVEEDPVVNSILASCPSLPARFPPFCSYMRLRRMVDEIKGLLAGCSPSSDILPVDDCLLETKYRTHIVQMEAQCFVLHQLLYHVVRLCGSVGSHVSLSLAGECVMWTHAKRCPTPEVTEQVQQRKKEARWRMVQSTLDGHSTSVVTRVGALAGSHVDALSWIVKSMVMSLAIFLQSACQPGFDVWESYSLVCGTTGSDLVHQHTINQRATQNAHQALLDLLFAFVHTQEALQLREAAMRRFTVSLPMWEKAYIEHVLLWAHWTIAEIEEMITFMLASDAPQLCWTKRRQFCSSLLQSMGTAIWHMKS